MESGRCGKKWSLVGFGGTGVGTWQGGIFGCEDDDVSDGEKNEYFGCG